MKNLEQSAFIHWLVMIGGLVITVLAVTGCHPSSSSDGSTGKSWGPDRITETAHVGEDLDSHVTYRAEVDVRKLDGSVWVLLNGFPTYSLKKGRFTEDHVDPSINAALIGSGNQYTLRIEPWVQQSGAELKIGQVEIGTRVSANEEQLIPGSKVEVSSVDSAYQVWKRRAEENWKKYRLKQDQSSIDSMRAWVARNPLTVGTTFENEAGPDFSQIFEEAPRLKDTPATRKRLKDYAMRLRDLMAAKDTSALFEEFRPSIEDRFEALSFSNRDTFMQQNQEAIVMEDPMLDFGPEDVRLRAWCDGRLWQLILKGGQNGWFFQTESGAGKGKIYVAEVEGDLKVVR